MQDTLSAASLRDRGWFDPKAVHALMERNHAGQIDATYPLFAVMCVELWARRFIDDDA
jgi:asparagine synthase (glutamine-hydrolysing)